MFYHKYMKRFFDVVLSGIALIIFSPLFLILWFLVRIKIGSPAIFCQCRLGKDEKAFTMYKLRTMSNEKDEKGELLPDEQRLSQFGKILRSSSLDELPELWNIFKGDMSIIGPRPLPDYYKSYYTAEECRRHDIRGGLTGYSQVTGRNYVKWEKKFEQDVYYVENCTLKLDIWIFLKTVSVVLKRDNIETASEIIHDGVIYRPLNIEREKTQKDAVN